MPQIGEVKYGNEIGKGKDNRRYIFKPCVKCGKPRWETKYQSEQKTYTGLCLSCHVRNTNANYQPPRGERSWAWKGGRITDHYGYIKLKIDPDDFFYQMATKKGYVREHRLVMAKHLGRNLHSWEIIHHLNGIKDDNRIENLKLCSTDGHNAATYLHEEIKRLKKRIKELEDEKKQNKPS